MTTPVAIPLLDELLRDPRAADAPVFVTARDAAALLCRSVSSLASLRSSGALREGEHWYRPCGGRIVYDRKALIRWVRGEARPRRLATAAPRGRGRVSSTPRDPRSGLRIQSQSQRRPNQEAEMKRHSASTNYRHGDVILLAADLPAGAVHEPPVGDIILAEGEVTGHAHRIKDTSEAKLFTWDSRRYLQVLAEAGVDLTHEEHRTLTLAPGVYEVRIQREYEPQGWRYVAD